jgi:uncharacterized protein YndB with AHSA1/START domain
VELKTKVAAQDAVQEIVITRDFDLPVALLFKAFAEAEFVEQWMGTKVLKLESKKHGSYQFETTDPKGFVHGFNGVIHEFVPNQKITRTFEMESASFGPQLEFYEFEPVTEDSSRLQMKVVFRSVADRNNLLKMPFAQGLSMAHDRIQNILSKTK